MLTAIRPLVLTMVFCGASVFTITGSTMIGKRNVTVRKDGGLVKSDECMLRCEKVDVDYSKKILGLWEGRMTSGYVEAHNEGGKASALSPTFGRQRPCKKCTRLELGRPR